MLVGPWKSFRDALNLSKILDTKTSVCRLGASFAVADMLVWRSECMCAGIYVMIRSNNMDLGVYVLLLPCWCVSDCGVGFRLTYIGTYAPSTSRVQDSNHCYIDHWVRRSWSVGVVLSCAL